MLFETWGREMSDWARTRGRGVALFGTVDSTQRVAAKLMTGSLGDGSGYWIFALHQSAATGRFGRPWASPHGAGVYASRLFSTRRAAVPALPQLIGVALCDGLLALGFECRLKWPNDVLLDGKKVGGILLSARGSGDTVRSVAGFGINHSHRREDLPRADSTSLRLAGSEVSLARLTRVLAERVDDELGLLRRTHGESQGELVERYRRLSVHRPGDRLAVNLGESVCEGEFAGFTANGALRIRGQAGERLLSAGEIES